MLTQEQIRMIIDKIAIHYEPERIILFGSYANRNATKDSDLDICVIKKTDKSFLQRSLELRKLIRPIQVAMDLFVFTPNEFEEKKELVNHIAYFANKYGIVSYEKVHEGVA